MIGAGGGWLSPGVPRVDLASKASRLGDIRWHWADCEMTLLLLLGLCDFQATDKIGVAFALLH